MERKDGELLKRLLPIFKIEAQDHLKIISSGLIEIEKCGPEKRAEIIEMIYRESHSLKGAARSVNLSHIVAICQSLENVFHALKRKEIAYSPRMLDLLHRAVDSAFNLVMGEDLSSSDKTGVGELIHRLDEVARKPRHGVSDGEEAERIPDGPVEEELPGAEPTPQSEAVVPAEHPSFISPAPSGTVRVPTSRLDSLLLQAEEMLSVKIAAGQLAGELRELNKALIKWKKGRMRSKSSHQFTGQEQKPQATRKGDFDSFISTFESRLANLVKSAEYDQRSFGAMVDTLLDDTKKTLLLPFSSLLEMFPKLARDLGRDAGKDIDLSAEGGEIEIDRRVLDEIKDPLIHVVRNCIDHGIETPAQRAGKNKPSRGKIGITIASRDGRIEIAVSDDGAGIDATRVKAAAQRCGAISVEEAEKLGDKDAQLLIFRSGVSTSPIITDISGRGLGLAIVRERVEKLNGTSGIVTKPGIGTTIRMVVPLTIATFRGVLVRAGEHLFLIPSANIEKVARVRKEEIQTVENRETIPFDGRAMSLVKLGAVLQLGTTNHRSRAEDPFIQVVVLGSAGKRMAFMIDEVIHEQEVLVKPLGSQLSRVRNIAGATVLGNGKVVPILNVSDLMISAVKISPAHAGALVPEPQKRTSILVVEDSITARTLLKTILESAGYDVATAVDGIDAFTALKTGEFDLVVSDVEMPRMNGFDLTARIRADVKLSELPVVLVTALESREDKERGINVGANAYVVKSSFEQSNLLEVIRRLV